MRLLYVIDSLGTGGAETLLCNTVNTLARHEDTVIHVVTLFTHLQESWRIADSAATVSSLGMRGKWDIVRGASRLKHLIREFRPDVIHVHLFPADVVTALAVKRSSSVPVIFSEHSEWNRRRAFGPLRLLDAWTYSHFDRIICVSGRVQDALRAWLPQVAPRTLVLQNAVDVPEEYWRSDAQVESDLLFVGRLVEAKGLDILLMALAELRGIGVRPTLRVVGEGPMRRPWESLCAQVGLQDQVTFLGRREDVKSLMTSTRAFVISSRWEGLPMVLLEAMSLGVPLVATRVAGVDEVLRTIPCGLMVDPGNSSALASAIARLLQDPEAAAAMGRLARHIVQERYSMAVYGTKMHDIYRVVTSDRGR